MLGKAHGYLYCIEFPGLYHVCFSRSFAVARVMNNTLEIVKEFYLVNK